MTHDSDSAWRGIVANALSWHEAHATFEQAVADLAPDVRGKRPDRFPHSAWELVSHIGRTQSDLVAFMSNPEYTAPEWPRDYWPDPAVPPTAEAWSGAIGDFHRDRDHLREIAQRSSLDLTSKIPWGDGQTYLRTLLVAIDHTSYHVAQIIMVRRLLGVWPESGG